MALANEESIRQLIVKIRDSLIIKDKTEAQALALSQSNPYFVYYTSDTHCTVIGGNIYGRGEELPQLFEMLALYDTAGVAPYNNTNKLYLQPANNVRGNVYRGAGGGGVPDSSSGLMGLITLGSANTGWRVRLVVNYSATVIASPYYTKTENVDTANMVITVTVTICRTFIENVCDHYFYLDDIMDGVFEIDCDYCGSVIRDLFQTATVSGSGTNEIDTSYDINGWVDITTADQANLVIWGYDSYATIWKNYGTYNLNFHSTADAVSYDLASTPSLGTGNVQSAIEALSTLSSSNKSRLDSLSAGDISYDLTSTPSLGDGDVQSAIEALDGKVGDVDQSKVEYEVLRGTNYKDVWLKNKSGQNLLPVAHAVHRYDEYFNIRALSTPFTINFTSSNTIPTMWSQTSATFTITSGKWYLVITHVTRGGEHEATSGTMKLVTYRSGTSNVEVTKTTQVLNVTRVFSDFLEGTDYYMAIIYQAGETRTAYNKCIATGASSTSVRYNMTFHYFDVFECDTEDEARTIYANRSIITQDGLVTDIDLLGEQDARIKAIEDNYYNKDDVDQRIDDEKVEFIKERYPRQGFSIYTVVSQTKVSVSNSGGVLSLITSTDANSVVRWCKTLVPKGSLIEWTRKKSTSTAMDALGYSSASPQEYFETNGTMVGFTATTMMYYTATATETTHYAVMPEDGYIIQRYYNTNNTTNALYIYDSTMLTTLYTEYYQKGVADGSGMASIVGLGYNIFDYISGSVDLEGFEYGCNLRETFTKTAPSGSWQSRYANSTKMVYFPKIDTSAVTDARSLFSRCKTLLLAPDFDLTGCGTTAERASYMFRECSNLLYVGDITGALGGNSAYYMFDQCTNLLQVGNVGTDNCASFARMFYLCSKLKRVESINMAKYTTGLPDTFKTCTALRYIVIKELGTPSGITTYNLSQLTVWGIATDEVPDARQSLIDTLLTYSFDRAAAEYSVCTITLSANTKALLTTEEIEQITAKGFTIA